MITDSFWNEIEAIHVRYFMSLLYSDDPEQLEQLKENIRQVIALITAEICGSS